MLIYCWAQRGRAIFRVGWAILAFKDLAILAAVRSCAVSTRHMEGKVVVEATTDGRRRRQEAYHRYDWGGGEKRNERATV